MREALALIAREWRMLRPTVLWSVLIGVVLCALAYLSVGATRRYLLLEGFLATLGAMPLGVAFFAAMISFMSMGRDVQHGTWDGLLLLPCSRGLLLATRLGVGLVLVAIAVLVPVVSFEALIALSPVTGGPVSGTLETLGEPPAVGALLAGLVTHLCTISAALMYRDRLEAYGILVLAPILGLFVALMCASGVMVGVLGTFVAVLLTSVVLAVRGAGSRGRSLLFAARAVSLAPACFVLLLAAGAMIEPIVERLRASSSTPRVDDAPETVVVIDSDGEFASVRPGDRASGMSHLGPLQERSHFLWGWHHAVRLDESDLFQHPARGVLMAYGRSSGLPAGCVGRGGLQASGPCEPFGQHLRVVSVRHGALIAADQGVFLLDRGTGRVTELHRGDVRAMAEISGRDNSLQIQSGSDLLIWTDASPDEKEDGPSEESAGAVSLPVLSRHQCRGVAGDGLIAGARDEFSFLGVRVLHPASRAQSLRICREGEVVEQREVRYDEYLGEDKEFFEESAAGSGLLQAALGPALSASRLPRYFPSALQRHRSSPGARWLSVAVAAAGLVALLVTFAALRRQRIPASVRAVSVVGGLVLGPAFSLACVLLLAWRRGGVATMRAAPG